MIMKITKRQLKNLVVETTEQKLTDKKKLLIMLRESMDGLRQAEMLADLLDIDIFSIFGSDSQAVNTILGPYVEKSNVLTDLIDSIGDNSFYEKSFFSALLTVLPTYPQFSLGMSSNDIMSLINSDSEEFYIYTDAESALGMTYQSTLESGGEDGIKHALKDWIVAVWFLKLSELHRTKGESFSLVDEIENLFAV